MLQRIRQSRPRRTVPAGERCELCARADLRTSTATSSTSRPAICCAPAAAATCSSPPRAREAAHYRAVPDRYLAFPDFQLSAGAVGLPADPGRRGLLLPQLRARPGGGLLPRPGRRHRVGAGPRHLGGGGRRQPGAVDPAARRRGLPGPARRIDHGGAECFIVPIDACYELVGQSAPAVARLRRRPRGPRRHGRVLRAGPGRRPDDEPGVRGDRRPGRSRTPRCRRSCCGCGSPRPTGAPCTPWPCGARSASSRNAGATSRRRRTACTSCSAKPPGGGTRCGPFLWTHVSTTISGFTRLDGVRPADRMHLRLRGGRRQVPARPDGRRDPADPAVLRHGVHPGGPGLRGRARLVEPRKRPTGCRSPCGAESWTCTSRTAAGCGSAGTPSTGCSTSRRRRPCPPGTRPSSCCSNRQARTARDRARHHGPLRHGPGRRRRRAVRGVRPVSRTGRRRARTSCGGSSGSLPRGRSARPTAPSDGPRAPNACIDGGFGPAGLGAGPLPAGAAPRRRSGDGQTASSSPSTDSRSTAQVYVAWDEAVDQVVDLPPLRLCGLGTGGYEEVFRFDGGSETDLIETDAGVVAARVIRRRDRSRVACGSRPPPRPAEGPWSKWP